MRLPSLRPLNILLRVQPEHKLWCVLTARISQVVNFFHLSRSAKYVFRKMHLSKFQNELCMCPSRATSAFWQKSFTFWVIRTRKHLKMIEGAHAQTKTSRKVIIILFFLLLSVAQIEPRQRRSDWKTNINDLVGRTAFSRRHHHARRLLRSNDWFLLQNCWNKQKSKRDENEKGKCHIQRRCVQRTLSTWTIWTLTMNLSNIYECLCIRNMCACTYGPPKR